MMSSDTSEFVMVPLAEWIGLKAELGQVRLAKHVKIFETNFFEKDRDPWRPPFLVERLAS